MTLLISTIISFLFFAALLRIKTRNEPLIDTSLPFKEYWGTTQIKFEKNGLGEYGIRRTYYLHGPCYGQPLFSYFLSKTANGKIVWNSADMPNKSYETLVFKSKKEAQKALELFQKQNKWEEL